MPSETVDPARLFAPLPGPPAPEVPLLTAGQIAAEWGMPAGLADAFQLIAQASPIHWSHKRRDEAREQSELLKRAWWGLSSYQRAVIRGEVAAPIGRRVTRVGQSPTVYVLQSTISADDVATMLALDQRLVALPDHLRAALVSPSAAEAIGWLGSALGMLKNTIDVLGEAVHG